MKKKQEAVDDNLKQENTRVEDDLETAAKSWKTFKYMKLHDIKKENA